MDDVRALLALLPDAPLPNQAEVAHADALILVHPPDESDYAAASERIKRAAAIGPPIYVVIPALDSGLTRTYLRQALQPGVYGVAVQTAASVDQLRYLEGVLEELELKAGIRPGLTAMVVGFHDPRAINIMSDALSAMRDSADRMTWIAFDHAALAESLGVEPDSPAVEIAATNVVLTATAYDLPVVYGSPPDAEYARSLGFRGCATGDSADLQPLHKIFTRPETAPDEEEDS